MQVRTKEQAIADFLVLIPYLRYAIKNASANGTIKLGILSVKEDGAGKVECQFDAGDFVEDLARVIGAPDYTKDDELSARAEEMLQTFGLK